MGGETQAKPDSFLEEELIQWANFSALSSLVSNFQPGTAPKSDSTDPRLVELSRWLHGKLPLPLERLVPASGDASFRRYFRAYSGGTSWIAMDAPPPMEDVKPFVAVAQLLEAASVTVPGIHAVDPEQGFVLLGDLGDLRYLDELSPDSADRLYRDAIDALVRFQHAVDIRSCGLPPYDEALLRRELGLFREWFLERLLGIALEPADIVLLEEMREALIRSAMEQPRVFVHRDYHSRNLMLCLDGNPGILDFQDAVIGPITYDLASLLRDCYIRWPDPCVDQWLGYYLETARCRGLPVGADDVRFRRWFDWMGLQRHLKAIGIFSRLKLRDHKDRYLADIPRTLRYAAEVCGRYPELSGFAAFLNTAVLSRSTEEVPI